LQIRHEILLLSGEAWPDVSWLRRDDQLPRAGFFVSHCPLGK
jgi:hypothetical protein